MTTVETAKAIRAELKTSFPSYKFSVRKTDCGVINIEHNGDWAFNSMVSTIVRKYESWNTNQTNYVFVSPKAGA